MHSGANEAMKQRGVVLIMVLVLLLAVTLLGAVVIQNATLQTKMVANAQARQQAFNNAEAVLAYAENYLATTSIRLSNIETIFKPDCDKGFCYMGSLGGILSEQRDCSLGAIPQYELWEAGGSIDVWKTSGKHGVFTPPNMAKEGMYIIEFRCFVDGSAKVSAEKGDALFRVTARGFSQSGEAVVMVQSTYRVSIF